MKKRTGGSVLMGVAVAAILTLSSAGPASAWIIDNPDGLGAAGGSGAGPNKPKCSYVGSGIIC